MPYVIELQPDGLDRMFAQGAGRKFYAGPIDIASKFMGLAQARTRHRSSSPAFDMLTLATHNIDNATRVSARSLMDDKAKELNRISPSMGARVVYDEPKALKMLKWLVTAPKAE